MLNIIISQFLWFKNPGHSLRACLCLKVSRQAVMKVLYGAVVLLECLNKRRFASELTQWLLAEFSFSWSVETEVLGSSLAVSWTSLSVPCQWASPQGNWILSQRVSKRKQERTGRTEACNLISEVTPIIFAVLYLLEVSPQDQFTCKAKELHKGVNPRKQESLGPSLRLPTTLVHEEFSAA